MHVELSANLAKRERRHKSRANCCNANFGRCRHKCALDNIQDSLSPQPALYCGSLQQAIIMRYDRSFQIHASQPPSNEGSRNKRAPR